MGLRVGDRLIRVHKQEHHVWPIIGHKRVFYIEYHVFGATDRGILLVVSTRVSLDQSEGTSSALRRLPST
jgi:hypothetical protein